MANKLYQYDKTLSEDLVVFFGNDMYTNEKFSPKLVNALSGKKVYDGVQNAILFTAYDYFESFSGAPRCARVAIQMNFEQMYLNNDALLKFLTKEKYVKNENIKEF
jgi:uncharacterized protein YpbB